jgi:hypothetical protein
MCFVNSLEMKNIRKQNSDSDEIEKMTDSIRRPTYLHN